MMPPLQLEKDATGKVTSIEAALHLKGDFKAKEVLKFHWVAAVDTQATGGLDPIPLVLTDFDYLIQKPKLEEEDDFESVVNLNTKFDAPALGEPAMRNLQRGDIIQLERKGFYRVDEPFQGEGRPMILFAIPDGKPRSFGVSSGGGKASPAAAGAGGRAGGGGGGTAAPAMAAPSPLKK
jgi:glutamyl-tRNA synthetase